MYNFVYVAELFETRWKPDGSPASILTDPPEGRGWKKSNSWIPTPNHVSGGAVLWRRKNIFSWSTEEPAMTSLHCLETLWKTKRSFNGKYDRMPSKFSTVPKTASGAEIKLGVWPLEVSLVVVSLRFYQCCQ